MMRIQLNFSAKEKQYLKKLNKFVIFLLLSIAIIITAIVYNNYLSKSKNGDEYYISFRNYYNNLNIKAKDPSDYNSFLAKIYQKKKLYINKSISEKNKFLTSSLKEIHSYWYNTKYDFNGSTNTPQKGKIACGYFVATTLHHLGFKFNRVKMAQQPAFKIINYFCDKKTIKWFKNTSYKYLKNYLKKYKEGYYIIGLDNHVGFIYYGNDIYFIHSNGLYPRKVIKERAQNSEALMTSKVINIGKLFSEKRIKEYFARY